jgi:hypothetical protein
MREYQVRICERLRVKFPGPTRQKRRLDYRPATSGVPPTPDISLHRTNHPAGPVGAAAVLDIEDLAGERARWLML